MRIFNRLLCACALAAGFGQVAEAATWQVTKTADTSDGACLPSDCSLREAIQSAIVSPGLDTVQVPAGTYVLSLDGRGEDFSMTGDLDIFNGEMRIEGAGSGATIIDAGGIDRVFHIVDGVVAISNLTIRGGLVNTVGVEDGGGVLNEGSLTLTNVVVRDSRVSAANGDGGGIYSTSNLVLQSSQVLANRATGTNSDGGGVWTNGRLQMTESTIDGNSASGTTSDGGGLLVRGNANILRSTISRNSAAGNTSDGGGIFNDGDLTMVNSTVSNNRTESDSSAGGGIFNEDSLTLQSVTIADNGSEEGSALTNVGFVSAVNTIIKGNCSGDTVDSNGGNLESPGNTCGLDQGTDLRAVASGDLALGALADNTGGTETHGIFSGSAALDKGRDDVCPATDQRGVARPIDGDGDSVARCDIGAFEGSAGPPPTCIADDQSLCLNDGRFRITADWRADATNFGSGTAVRLTSDSGYFWFFDSGNIEVVIKVLNACTFNNRFWVFATGLTNVEVDLTVEDTVAGTVKTYRNPLGQPYEPILDTEAFATCDASLTSNDSPSLFADPAWSEPSLVAQSPHVDTDKIFSELQAQAFGSAEIAVSEGSEAKAGAEAKAVCVADDEHLCLSNQRFQIGVEYRDTQGMEGVGKAVALTGDTGYFWFFESTNVEVVIKVLQGCGFNDHFWVFAGGLTNVEVTLTVRDTVSNTVVEYLNSQGRDFKPIADVEAFNTCP